MPFSLRLPSFLKRGKPRFSFRIPIPDLTAAEKTALLALALVLSSGGALRWWEESGVRIGPVDDWESLRALVINAREQAGINGEEEQGAGGYPCRDDDPSTRFGNTRGGGASGSATIFAAGAAYAEKGTDARKPSSAESSKSGAGKKPPARSIDVNTAGERTLVTLPGVGPSTAKAILAHRAAHGRFRSVDELLKVKGIGPKKLEALRPFIKVEGPPPASNEANPAGPGLIPVIPAIPEAAAPPMAP